MHCSVSSVPGIATFSIVTGTGQSLQTIELIIKRRDVVFVVNSAKSAAWRYWSGDFYSFLIKVFPYVQQ